MSARRSNGSAFTTVRVQGGPSSSKDGAVCGEKDHGRCFAALIIGPDQFRAVNETLGHELGNDVLSRIGERIRSTMRRNDRLLRLPGDEFSVLIPDEVSPAEVTSIVQRIRDLVQRTYMVQGQLIDITISIGVAISGDGQQESDKLVRHASAALKSAKAAGVGSVQFFEKYMEDQIAQRYTLTLDLRKALLLRQFEVFYQPQVDIDSGRLTGFEALLRWRHPKLGWISPADFIPLAEELGLIGQIGEWVLRTACKQAASLPENIVVAVNASPLQVEGQSFLGSVKRALEVAAIPPSRLEVEITEGVLLRKERGVLATLDELRAMGVRTAMDDFGTGYSSLGQLAEFPFDTIKIDRSLVGGSGKQRAIVRAIATLGKGMGMSTLVEGIETQEQRANARMDGCVLAQGYLFGKPRPASELEQVLRRFSQGMRSHTQLSDSQSSDNRSSTTV